MKRTALILCLALVAMVPSIVATPTAQTTSCPKGYQLRCCGSRLGCQTTICWCVPIAQ